MKICSRLKSQPNKKGKNGKFIGKGVQFADFGVVTSENIVTGRHPSIGSDHAVIGSGDCHTGSTIVAKFF